MDRRGFVRTASGLIIAAALDGCGGGGNEPPVTPKGSLLVRVTGFDPSATSAGFVVVTFLDQTSTPVTVNLTAPSGGVSATTQDQLPVGNYRVEYTQPGGYNLASGTVNPRTVAVTENNATQVDFGVELIPTTQFGNITVAVTGLQAGVANGGSAVLQRTDASGSPITVNIPASGTASPQQVVVGTYSVTYTPPSGYNVTPPAQQTGIVVAVNQTVTVTFAVTVQPTGGLDGDIYEFSFEDGTVGSFVNSSGQPLSSPWTIDGAVGYRGTKSIKQTYNVSTGNVGVAMFFQLAPTRKSYYCRWAYMQSNPFNNNGTINNADQVKMQRGLGPGFQPQLGSFFIGVGNFNNGRPAFGWDSLASSLGDRLANVNQPAPNFNNLLGQWVVIETFWDITANPIVFKCWINGTQYFDYADTVSPAPSGSYAVIQWDGTINSMASANSTAWFDKIGLATRQMGFPPPNP